MLIYDPGEHDQPAAFKGKAYAMPLDQMAREMNLRKGKNLIALGALSALLDLDFQQLQATVKDKYGKRPEFIESNRMGGMGKPEAIPFSERESADAFSREFGGKVVTLAHIPQEYILR